MPSSGILLEKTSEGLVDLGRGRDCLGYVGVELLGQYASIHAGEILISIARREAVIESRDSCLGELLQLRLPGRVETARCLQH